MDFLSGEILWEVPLAPPRLNAGDVHVWCASLELTVHARTQYAALSPDEMERGRNFRFSRDRHRFIVARGILRQLLAQQLQVQPAEVRFRYTPLGKPLLDHPEAPQIYFNLAHCENLALYAFSRDAELGVDLERLRPLADLEELARHYFTATENETLCSLPPEERPMTFLQLWTRKEALLKATGEGLSGGLTALDVSVWNEAWVEKFHPGSWQVCELIPALGFIAALALRGRYQRLHCWHWVG